MNRRNFICLALVSASFLAAGARGDNPVIMDQFTADPTARLFDGKIFLYPSHDMPEARTIPNPQGGGVGWFAMEDYHVFSTENLLDWNDHGKIVDQKDVPWVRGAANAMWAPDCVFRDGKYYFYFPASNRIGLAISDKPEGPFKIEPQSVANGIDPCCFIDWDKYKKDLAAAKEAAAKNGAAPADVKPDVYLVWAGGGITLSKMNDNMRQLEGQTVRPNLQPAAAAPASAPAGSAPAGSAPAPGRGGRGRGGGGGGGGLIEGPFMFQRNGIYYLTYPHAVNRVGYESECLEYATATNPMGPYTYKGVIMDQSPPPNIITQEMRDLKLDPKPCWTNHHSFVEYQGQWILFYHDKDLSPEFDKDRAVRADYVTFGEDGTINKVAPTLRGIGTCDAKRHIQIDRYSAVSKTGTTLSFLDEKKRVLGWKIALTDAAFVEYDRVDFGKSPLKSVKVRAASAEGATVEIHLDKADGPLVAKVQIPKSGDLQETAVPLTTAPEGLHNLVVSTPGGAAADANSPRKSVVDLDWVSFE